MKQIESYAFYIQCNFSEWKKQTRIVKMEKYNNLLEN